MDTAIAIVTLSISIITILISLVVYMIQQQIQNANLFNRCARSLHSSNPMEQNTAAILLRTFLRHKRRHVLGRDFKREAKNLMVVLLRDSIPTTLQKTLADGFSYAEDLKGQDMQFVNMLGALIKPQSWIDYEITKKEKYRYNRLSLKKADFYYAVLQECSINSVDATGAIFYCAIMPSTKFRNCILRDANFTCSNIKHVEFDENCDLEGAMFDGAIGLDLAKVKVKETINGDVKIEKYSISDFLDAKGVFHYDRSLGNKYNPHKGDINIFVSKLGAMDSQQTLHYDAIQSIIGGYDNFKLRSIERSQYRPVSQLIDIETKLQRCYGCVIFAFEYLKVESGVIHQNVVGNDHQVIKDKNYASPWLHIETALANGKQMPCLIIYDQDLQRNGMFDEMISRSDKNLICLPFSSGINKNTPEILEWVQRVNEYYQRKRQEN